MAAPMCLELEMRVASAVEWIRRHLGIGWAVIVFVAITPTSTRAQEHPVFDGKGAQRGHQYFGQLPEENIDTLNGNLHLTFTDLALPGNAGLDLRITRSYNSKGRAWTFGLEGLPMKVLDAEAQPPGGRRL